MASENTHLRSMRFILWIGGLYLFFRFLFAPLLPFLLALGLSTLLEPTVQKLRRAMGVKRSFAAVVVTTALLLLLGSVIALLTLRLTEELTVWSSRLPEILDAFPSLWNGVLDHIESWYNTCPSFLRTALDHLAVSLSENTPEFVGKLGGYLMEKASALAAVLPDVTLFFITTVLALYFTAVNYGMVLAFLKRQLPLQWQNRCRSAVHCFRSAILKWLRSELVLILVTFLILLMGFLWMGLDFALLAAAFIALIDALPVLGTGTILIPWSFFCFLLGDTPKALALIALYGVALLVHSLLEPRLLAGQGNLPSIAVLFAMYLGYRFFSITGMLALPVLLLIAKQLQDAGVIRLWH